MKSTTKNEKLTGNSDNLGPAVGSMWCASQRSIRSKCSTTGNAQMKMKTGTCIGDTTVTDFMKNGPLVEESSRLSQLFDQIRSAIIQSNLEKMNRSSATALDSDDDSFDDDDNNEWPHRSPSVRQSIMSHSAEIRFDPAEEIVAVKTRYIREGSLDTSSTESRSVVVWSLDLEQPWPSDKEWSCWSDSELPSPSNSDLRSTSHSELNWSTDSEQLEKPNLVRAWLSNSELRSTSHSESIWSSDYEQSEPSQLIRTWRSDLDQSSRSQLEWEWSTDDERLSSSALKNMWLSDSDLRSASYSTLNSSRDKIILFGTLDVKEQSLSDSSELSLSSHSLMITTSAENRMISFRDEMNEVIIYEEEQSETVNDAVETAGNDTAELTVEVTTPKRRTFLTTIGKWILKAGRKLCCCGGGGGGRNRN
ncbi:hypothetical protein AGLY_010144 [Aphis glycines]|uniref:Uncharacterized protein n=1 Tax=Aphis glycines TaxID=307491 RepID=A0A6G0TFB9_APHGL|nr:hypothetical protein AGLY_010144 [Aphis glycines]